MKAETGINSVCIKAETPEKHRFNETNFRFNMKCNGRQGNSFTFQKKNTLTRKKKREREMSCEWQRGQGG